jgi:plastocyanin
MNRVYRALHLLLSAMIVATLVVACGVPQGDTTTGTSPEASPAAEVSPQTSPEAEALPEAEASPEASPEATEAAGAAVTVEADSFYFEPQQFSIPANTDVQVEVFNEADIPHTFTIEEIGIDVELQPDERQSVSINAAPGQYTYICTFHPDRMQGMMTVE